MEKGDIAICVNIKDVHPSTKGSLPSLRLNAEYIVQNIKTCECGQITLDVGLSDDNSGVKCKCGAKSSPKSGIWWCASERFVKKQTKSIEEQIEEAIEIENYELANELQKQL